MQWAGKISYISVAIRVFQTHELFMNNANKQFTENWPWLLGWARLSCFTSVLVTPRTHAEWQLPRKTYPQAQVWARFELTVWSFAAQCCQQLCHGNGIIILLWVMNHELFTKPLRVVHHHFHVCMRVRAYVYRCVCKCVRIYLWLGELSPNIYLHIIVHKSIYKKYMSIWYIRAAKHSPLTTEEDGGGVF